MCVKVCVIYVCVDVCVLFSFIEIKVDLYFLICIRDLQPNVRHGGAAAPHLAGLWMGIREAELSRGPSATSAPPSTHASTRAP